MSVPAGGKVMGHGDRFSVRIVNYADDFVIFCPLGRTEDVMKEMMDMMSRLKLEATKRRHG